MRSALSNSCAFSGQRPRQHGTLLEAIYQQHAHVLPVTVPGVRLNTLEMMLSVLATAVMLPTTRFASVDTLNTCAVSL